MRIRRCLAVCSLAGMMLLAGCAGQKQESRTASPPAAEWQTGYLDSSDLDSGEVYSEPLTGNYEMADEKADPPAAELTRCKSPDGEVFVFDKAGRLRSYSSGKQNGAVPFTESLKAEELLRQTCDEVLSSYISDYAAYTEITSRYYEDDSVTYNLAMEHKIADGITDTALIRLDEAGEVYDLTISYADADGDCAGGDFVTDADKAYFDKQVQPYLTALEDYSAEVTYIQYKHLNGKIYAYYEVAYTDGMTGISSGAKLVIFVK